MQCCSTKPSLDYAFAISGGFSTARLGVVAARSRTPTILRVEPIARKENAITRRVAPTARKKNAAIRRGAVDVQDDLHGTRSHEPTARKEFAGILNAFADPPLCRVAPRGVGVEILIGVGIAAISNYEGDGGFSADEESVFYPKVPSLWNRTLTEITLGISKKSDQKLNHPMNRILFPCQETIGGSQSYG